MSWDGYLHAIIFEIVIEVIARVDVFNMETKKMTAGNILTLMVGIFSVGCLLAVIAAAIIHLSDRAKSIKVQLNASADVMNYPAASGRGIKDRNPARTFRRRAAGY